MKFFAKKSALALIVVFTLLFSLAACKDDTPEVKIYSDRVYVSDHLFISTGDSSDALPDGYTSIGIVETLLSKTEPVESNYASNCLEVGSELYLPAGINLDDMTSSIKLYGKDNTNDEYEIFSLMFVID
ncbi:hypothetical protein ADH76_25565 [Enterocloster clostridioformis]|uniref:hypothetical protein n=1 Tax=Enterocloster clostridioformis TaxID=1531 RepID=UPI00080C81F1|nr:hypothetical protein [Enterocloster clostridioformis]ANU49374.1 hypothetical protein A4V08_29635 [Lachnoclostridium sp. YL32]NDO31791.1 hypothetical protein [Enterocloster clostridioformis]OXE64288.1 hypothetical protein ADH76_25565 [Enterocloster clostridioformis]QQR01699.1 hypothetical protein I5Q83_04965 [Enterocloster clostridioformis]